MQSDVFTIFYIFTVDCLGNERFFLVVHKRRISYKWEDLGDRRTLPTLPHIVSTRTILLFVSQKLNVLYVQIAVSLSCLFTAGHAIRGADVFTQLLAYCRETDSGYS